MKICINKYKMLNYQRNAFICIYIHIYIYIYVIHIIVDFTKNLFVTSVFALSIGLRKKYEEHIT